MSFIKVILEAEATGEVKAVENEPYGFAIAIGLTLKTQVAIGR